MRKTKKMTWAAVAAFAGLAAAAAQEIRPSRWGADDTLGAVNLLSREAVVRAAELVTTGKTYSLGVETGPATPAFGTRWSRITVIDLGSNGANKVTGHDDLLTTWLGIGSQLDGLGHVGIDGVHYNGVPRSEFYNTAGITRFGMEDLPPIVTRGVLLDMARHAGKERLEPGTALNSDEIAAAARQQGVMIGTGDVVLLHTGWLSVANEDPQRFLSGAPGIGVDGARYLVDRGVVAVGADTWGVEVAPEEVAGQFIPVHQLLLAENGVYILENMDTRELAADRAYEFMFVLGQPKFTGAVQTVINPVAIR